jgi:hypothetical protein
MQPMTLSKRRQKMLLIILTVLVTASMVITLVLPISYF